MILRAHNHLRAIKSSPFPTPAPFSAATLAFDPYVGRTLQMATPIRVVAPPSFEDTCMAVERFLDGLFETSVLASSDHLTTWQVRHISDLLRTRFTHAIVGDDRSAPLVAEFTCAHAVCAVSCPSGNCLYVPTASPADLI